MVEISREAVRRLLEECATSFQRVLESLTGAEASVDDLDPSGAQPGALGAVSSDLRWWSQRFNVAGQMWVGGPKSACLELGSLVLRSAGVEEASETEAMETWQEILQQSFSGFAAQLGSSCNTEISSRGNVESAEAPADFSPGQFRVRVGGSQAILFIGFEAALINFFSERVLMTSPDRSAETPPQPAPTEYSPLQSLLDSQVCVRLIIGRTRMTLAEALRITSGSMIELDRAVNEPIDIVVNHQVIGRGQAVQVNGNYGIKIEELQTALIGKF
jgi:flagellar motor switch protein FliN/FliY